MRPFTLNTLYGFVNTIRSGIAPVNDARFRELLRVAVDLGFIDGNYTITGRGLEFLRAFENGDSESLHKLLMDGLEPYRRIYELLTKGVTKPGELVRLTGYNAVVVDLVLRLISEIESLSRDSIINESLYEVFEKALLEKYRGLSRRRWSKYVQIRQLLDEVRGELYIPNRLVGKLLEEFVRRWRDRVVLTGAPGAGLGNDSVEVFGKKYVYMMINMGD